jgi:hypothetical protein
MIVETVRPFQVLIIHLQARKEARFSTPSVLHTLVQIKVYLDPCRFAAKITLNFLAVD